MSGQACATGCGGTVLDDGYCDTCGTKAGAAAGTPAPAPVALASVAPGASCPTGCGGTVLDDGYCDTCGTKADTATRVAAPTSGLGPVSASGAVRLDASLRTSGFASGSVSGMSRRTRRDTTRTSVTQRSIGRGLVTVPPAPEVDPQTVVMDVPEVAEHKRWCSSCGEAVGRSRGDREGRSKGFCSNCRTPFDYDPKLVAGDVVGGQYEVVGAIAHGGLGWIYLAKDTALSGRWVVLKGLLNQGDDAAMAAAVAERKFLAQVSHPAVVEVFNFVTHQGAGYTVMEFVGGRSLKQLLKQRRKDGEGPLPVEQAIAYVLAVLPAFEYLHGQGLVYCDFKPDNVIQVGDDVKLIDLGGVRRVDDPEADIYGTVGFQAPEVPTRGVSFASDLYTIGRSIAVLTCDWPEYNRSEADRLPDPLEHPALRDNEPFLRWLRKACAPHPDDRFQTASEMSDQLLGVLRQLVAARTGSARPAQSNVFAGAPAGDQLVPWLAVNPDDPAAAFLGRLTDEPADAIREIDEAIAAGTLEDTIEVRLRYASDLVELGRLDEAGPILDDILGEDPWEWRAAWVQGYAALERGDHAAASAAFDRCRSEVPGELAPLYAAALAAEGQGQADRAAVLYDLVATVDPSWTKAAFGLARVRAARGDTAGAVTALDRIPATHRRHSAGQAEAARILMASGDAAGARARIDAAGLEPRQRAELEIDALEAALGRAGSGTRVSWDGRDLDERGLRLELERAIKRLARTADDDAEREALVDRANALRPVTLF